MKNLSAFIVHLHTISIDKVESIEGNSIEIDGVRYVIGRTYIDSVKKILISNTN